MHTSSNNQSLENDTTKHRGKTSTQRPHNSYVYAIGP